MSTNYFKPDEYTHETPAWVTEAVENGTWTRAGGECVCPVCGKLYSRHPAVSGEEWLTELCDRVLVKL
jgi:hypothetical protein